MLVQLLLVLVGHAPGFWIDAGIGNMCLCGYHSGSMSRTDVRHLLKEIRSWAFVQVQRRLKLNRAVPEDRKRCCGAPVSRAQGSAPAVHRAPVLPSCVIGRSVAAAGC